ncbi:hypothetical protein PM082_024538 [Marasmius tenuissimus]|nr:hypothetical protein PM082_024538 [Marasmius tenuissimus]
MFATSKGHNLHLRQAASCKGWMFFSKSRAAKESIDDKITHDDSTPLHDGYATDEFEVENNLFHWIENTMDIDIGEAGPGPRSTERNSGLKRMAARIPFSIMIKETEVFSEPHKNGGKVIRMAEPLYEKWRARFEDKDESEDEDKDDEDAVYSPFASKRDWQIAQWAVQENIGQGVFDRLLKIPGVIERLELSFKTSRHLNKIVNSIPARGSQWKTKDFRFNDTPPDEIFSVRYRDPLEAIKALWGDPSLAEHLVFKPSKMFSDSGKTRRNYSEMWTGKWWWAMQSRLQDKDATIPPVIVATDKTQLTQFSGSRSAYPVYLTLGNIPRQIWRQPSQQACILIAYLPVDKIAKHNLTKKEHSACYSRLFHESMHFVLSPLAEVSASGAEMVGGDGAVRKVHPIVSCYVADYPEQCLVGCSKYGTCPKCQCSKEQLSEMSVKPKRTQTWTTSVIDTAKITTPNVPQYVKSCMSQGVSGYIYKPFWMDFWGTDVYMSLTPDVLDQLYQGVFKHLVKWCQEILSEEELDW